MAALQAGICKTLHRYELGESFSVDNEGRKQGTVGMSVVENLMAPDIFADEVTYFAIGNGIVALTLTSVRWDNSVEPARQVKVVTSRLRLPVGPARALATGLHDFLEKQGVPAVSVEEKKRVQ